MTDFACVVFLRVDTSDAPHSYPRSGGDVEISYPTPVRAMGNNVHTLMFGSRPFILSQITCQSLCGL